jgi:hypothetical protein
MGGETRGWTNDVCFGLTGVEGSERVDEDEVDDAVQEEDNDDDKKEECDSEVFNLRDDGD